MFKKLFLLCLFCLTSAGAMDFAQHFDAHRPLVERSLCAWTKREYTDLLPEYRGNLVYLAVLSQFAQDIADWFMGRAVGSADDDITITVDHLQAMAKFLAGERDKNPVWDVITAVEYAKDHPTERESKKADSKNALQKVPSFMNQIMRPHRGALISSTFKCSVRA